MSRVLTCFHSFLTVRIKYFSLLNEPFVFFLLFFNTLFLSNVRRVADYIMYDMRREGSPWNSNICLMFMCATHIITHAVNANFSMNTMFSTANNHLLFVDSQVGSATAFLKAWFTMYRITLKLIFWLWFSSASFWHGNSWPGVRTTHGQLS